MTSLLFGKIEDGKVKIQRFFAKELAGAEGKQVEVRIVERQRSEQQNRYLWGVVYKLVADYTGFTSDEVHQVFRQRFLSYERTNDKGKLFTFQRSTTDLTTKEFSEYVEKVRQYASQELGLIIPDPDIQDLVD